MTRQPASDRLSWAVSTLRIEPHHRVLEIGCGHGVAVSLVCGQLDGGRIIAIDRSPKMIEVATTRNADHVATGTASFECVALRDFDAGGLRFDTIFAIHVGVLLRPGADREFQILEDCLAARGRFFLINQPLDPTKATQTAEAMTSVLTGHGFTVDQVRVEDLGRDKAISIRSRPG